MRFNPTYFLNENNASIYLPQEKILRTQKHPFHIVDPSP